VARIPLYRRAEVREVADVRVLHVLRRARRDVIGRAGIVRLKATAAIEAVEHERRPSVRGLRQAAGDRRETCLVRGQRRPQVLIAFKETSAHESPHRRVQRKARGRLCVCGVERRWNIQRLPLVFGHAVEPSGLEIVHIPTELEGLARRGCAVRIHSGRAVAPVADMARRFRRGGRPRDDVHDAAERVIAPQRRTAAADEFNLIDRLEWDLHPLHDALVRTVDRHAVQHYQRARVGARTQTTHRDPVGREMHLVRGVAVDVDARHRPDHVVERLRRCRLNDGLVEHADARRHLFERPLRPRRRDHDRRVQRHTHGHIKTRRLRGHNVDLPTHAEKIGKCQCRHVVSWWHTIETERALSIRLGHEWGSARRTEFHRHAGKDPTGLILHVPHNGNRLRRHESRIEQDTTQQ